jgi:ADP-ribose pyrophosphatase
LLETGQRELLEETGYVASDWVKLGLQHPCIGYSNEVIHIFLARGLEMRQHARDEDEHLEVFELDFKKSLSMIFSGEITDGKTIVALMFAQHYLLSHD